MYKLPTKEEFLSKVYNASGKAVYDFIDKNYGVAEKVRRRGFDCSNTDSPSTIIQFIIKSYEALCETDVNDFPGENRIIDED